MSLPKPQILPYSPAQQVHNVENLMSFGGTPKPTPTPPPPTINQATQNVNDQMAMLQRRGAAATVYAGQNAPSLGSANLATKTLLGS